MSRSLIAGINAEFRRRETERTSNDRILQDRWAKSFAFLGWQGRLIDLLSRLVPSLKRTVDELQTVHCVRHASIDRLLLEAIRSNGIRQVVVIGAGFDMRPSRFCQELSGVTWFEVDLPDSVHLKETVLAKWGISAFDVHRVPLNLREERLSSLAHHKYFDRSKPTLFIAEGLIHYLSLQSFEALLRDVGDLAPSRLIFSYIDSEMYNSASSTLVRMLRFLREIPVLHFSREKMTAVLQSQGFAYFRTHRLAAQMIQFVPQSVKRIHGPSQEVATADSFRFIELMKANHEFDSDAGNTQLELSRTATGAL